MELFDLSGKTALITGASGGLGESFARALAGAGARVVLAARRGCVRYAAVRIGFRIAACEARKPANFNTSESFSMGWGAMASCLLKTRQMA